MARARRRSCCFRVLSRATSHPLADQPRRALGGGCVDALYFASDAGGGALLMSADCATSAMLPARQPNCAGRAFCSGDGDRLGFRLRRPKRSRDSRGSLMSPCRVAARSPRRGPASAPLPTRRGCALPCSTGSLRIIQRRALRRHRPCGASDGRTEPRAVFADTTALVCLELHNYGRHRSPTDEGPRAAARPTGSAAMRP